MDADPRISEQDPNREGAGTRGPGEAAAEAGPPDDLRDRVREALRSVVDPELGINIVDLGLVYDVRVEDGIVEVDYTLTTMGCPIGPLIEQQMQHLLDQVPGVRGFRAELVFRPPWTPEMMSEEAKAALGIF
ncbi:MAG TPA: metal-sulfur cluster assembly factor [Actinomycetota bacterium]|nr:metal-sulfur cluster assembly factor [Actinomycetota bacterium]